MTSKKLKSWSVEIEKWHPTSVNKLLGRHHMSRHKIKQGDMQMIGVYFYNAKVPKATGRRHVAMDIYKSGGGRAPDPDNLFKSVLDALVKLGYLLDDSSKYLTSSWPEIYRAKQKKTVITITDLDY
jgi:hypothetical protein